MANITVAEAANTARDEHPSFDRNAHPDRVLMRFLTRYQQRLLTQIAQLRPDAIVSIYEIDVPVFDFDDGEDLPGHILVHGADVIYRQANTEPDPLRFVGFALRHEDYSTPVAYMDRTTLFLNGKRADWQDVRRIDVRYFPRGRTLTAMTDELDLPGQAIDACASALALFMARRTTKALQVSIDVAGMVNEAASAESRYIDEITGRKQISVHYQGLDW